MFAHNNQLLQARALVLGIGDTCRFFPSACVSKGSVRSKCVSKGSVRLRGVSKASTRLKCVSKGV